MNGGGIFGGSADDCIVVENAVSGEGGGASQAELANCLVADNSAAYAGGGAAHCTLTNSTVIGNRTGVHAGGVAQSKSLNSIVWGNEAPRGPNWYGATYRIHNREQSFAYSCTAPLPDGPGNIDQDPLLSSPAHLSSASPCIGAGTTGVVAGTDIDGEAWANPPSMGCDEYIVGAVTGILEMAFQAAYTHVAVGFAVDFASKVRSRTTHSEWSFGDGTVLSVQPYVAHAWSTAGSYDVVLTAYNNSYPGGLATSVTLHVVDQPVLYVDAAGASPSPPYHAWTNAAATIQDAVDAATGLRVGSTSGDVCSGLPGISGMMKMKR